MAECIAFITWIVAATILGVIKGRLLSDRTPRLRSAISALLLSIAASVVAFFVGLFGFRLAALGEHDAEGITMVLWILVGGPTSLLIFPFALWLGRDLAFAEHALYGAILFVVLFGLFGALVYAHPPDILIFATLAASFQAAWLVYSGIVRWLR